MADKKVATMETVQDRMTEKLQETFMDLVPPEMWTEMVAAHVNRMKQEVLPNLIEEMFKEKAKEVITAEFNSDQWRETWSNAGSMGASEMVKDLLIENGAEVMASMFGSMAQNVVLNMRNQF